MRCILILRKQKFQLCSLFLLILFIIIIIIIILCAFSGLIARLVFSDEIFVTQLARDITNQKVNLDAKKLIKLKHNLNIPLSLKSTSAFQEKNTNDPGQ